LLQKSHTVNSAIIIIFLTHKLVLIRQFWNKILLKINSLFCLFTSWYSWSQYASTLIK
jgi:hypothetical protein